MPDERVRRGCMSLRPATKHQHEEQEIFGAAHKTTGSLMVRRAEAFSNLFLQYGLHPFLLVQIPADGFTDALLELVRGCPAQFALDLGGVNGITAVVAGAVFDVGDELARIAAQLRRKFVNRV